MAIRITFVEFGDYREAYERLARGGPETYRAQRYSVGFVGDLAKHGNSVTVIRVNAPRHEVRLANGVVAVGLYLWRDASQMDLVRVLARTRPTHVVLRSPILCVVAWAVARRVALLPLLADGFGCDRRLRPRLREAALAWCFNRLPVVANHQVNASFSLLRAAVKAHKVVPWDEPRAILPTGLPPKKAPDATAPLRLVQVGSLIRSKGVGDVIRAVGELRDGGMEVVFTVIGDGPDRASLQAEAASLGLQEVVRFLGLVAHHHIVPQMREHDVVIQASHPEYTEAWPHTLLEAWSSQTPLVASDHPMFRGLVVDGQTGLSFRAGSSSSLATALQRLRGDGALYERLSRQATTALSRLPCAVPWDKLLTRFLDDRPGDRAWLRSNSMASGKYRAWVEAHWAAKRSR